MEEWLHINTDLKDALVNIGKINKKSVFILQFLIISGHQNLYQIILLMVYWRLDFSRIFQSNYKLSNIKAYAVISVNLDTNLDFYLFLPIYI